jgi:hypothetical protein
MGRGLVRDSFTPCPSRGEGCSDGPGKDPRRSSHRLIGKGERSLATSRGLDPLTTAHRSPSSGGSSHSARLPTLWQVFTAALRKQAAAVLNARLFDHFGQ